MNKSTKKTLVSVLALVISVVTWPTSVSAYDITGTVDGKDVSINGISQNPDGTWSGTFNSSHGQFSSHNGMTAMYSQTLDSWVVSDPVHDSSDNAGSGGTTYQGQNVKTRTFCDGTNPMAEITVLPRALFWDYNLWIEGIWYGGIDAQNQEPKVVSLPGHNWNQRGAPRYTGSIEHWSIGSWPFSFEAPNCAPENEICYMDANGVSSTYRGYFDIGNLNLCDEIVIPDVLLPKPPPVATISANPSRLVISQTETTNITYGPSSAGGPATACYVSGPGLSHSNSGGQSTVSTRLNSVGNYTYTAYCAGPGGTSPQVSTVVNVVYPPPIVDLNANPTQIRYGNPSTLTWTSRWTTAPCQASLGWSGNKALNNTSGESTGNLIANSAFRLICPAMGQYSPGVDDASVGVTSCIAGASMSVSKKIVRKGEEVTITYNTGAANPAQCVLRVGSAELVGNLEDNGDTSTSCSDGRNAVDRTYDYTVNGEATVTLECEGMIVDEETIRVLPEFQET